MNAAKPPIANSAIDGLNKLLIEIKTPLEAVNTSAGVYQLLLTGEERVTLRANVNYDILLCGASFNNIAASTTNCCLIIVRMYTLFHVVSPLSGSIITVVSL